MSHSTPKSDRRIQELITLAMEDHGHIINLVTGQLIENGAAQRIYPTTAAQAEHYVATLTGGL